MMNSKKEFITIKDAAEILSGSRDLKSVSGYNDEIKGVAHSIFEEQSESFWEFRWKGWAHRQWKQSERF